MWIQLFTFCCFIALTACSSTLPPRFVLERNMGDFSYRRYQNVIDIEFPIPGYAAQGHTAMYRGLREGNIFFALAFVTVYEQSAGLVATIREQLLTLDSYELDVVRQEGEYLWRLQGDQKSWLLWVSNKHLIKLGVSSTGNIPEILIEEYTDIYPSDLDEEGHAREGVSSAGPPRGEEEEELEVPSSLREGAPR